MDARVRRFRKEARKENGGCTGKRRRYSRGLRAEGVAYLRERMKQGASFETVVSELGVSGWSLVRWRRGVSAEKSSKLQPVEEVSERVDDASTSAVSVVTPDGYRIEGLDRGEVASMLELLR